jgi:hypothetical protein
VAASVSVSTLPGITMGGRVNLSHADAAQNTENVCGEWNALSGV